MKNFWNFHRANFSFRPCNRLFLILCLAILLVAQSCKKDPNSIGTNIMDPDERLGAAFTDTITLTAYSVLEDTISTANLRIHYLGYLRDRIFGTTVAGIYTQFVPNGRSVDFGTTPKLDSIVLMLRYTGGFYGDTLNPFLINVYRLKEGLSDKYYQTSSVPHDAVNLTYTPNFRVYPKPNTKVKVDSLSEAHIRIRLSDALGNDFLNNVLQMQSFSDFQKFFKGLYIETKPDQQGKIDDNGALISFSLANNPLSGIRIYYKNDTVSRRYFFPVKESRRFNTYEHDYELGDPDFKRQVIQSDSSLGQKVLYVQATGGVKTKITFPYLKSLKDKKIIINKAELVITNIEEDATLSKYPAPVRLNMYGVNKKGENVVLPDAPIFVSSAYWGGTYDAAKKEYRFRLTRYIQDMILNDNFRPYIYLVIDGAASNVNRLKLSGTNPVDLSSRLRLEVYYTEH